MIDLVKKLYETCYVFRVYFNHPEVTIDFTQSNDHVYVTNCPQGKDSDDGDGNEVITILVNDIKIMSSIDYNVIFDQLENMIVRNESK